jgi:membrane associated rhomboid family serine protease
MTPTSVGMRCPECAGEKTKVRTAANIRAGSTGLAPVAVTVGLIAVNVVAFVASGQLAPNSTHMSSTVFQHGALYGPPVADGEDWRLVTSGFLHGGQASILSNLLHIGFNMFLLWILGQMLEPTLGHVKFALVYFVALLAGSFGALLLSPDSVTVGASGAVFGLMGAAAVELNHRGRSIMEAGIGGLIIINLVLSFTFSGISIGGHIGGLIGGALAMFAIHQADRMRQPVLGYVACFVIAAISVVGGIAAAHTAHGGTFGL